MKVAIRVVVIILIVAAIGACVHYFGDGNLSARESGFLGIVLTGLSVLASWAVTDMYSASQYRDALEEVQEQHRTNLRTYALKAAEKVNNLSSELGRLAVYLQQELDYDAYASTAEELAAKEERLESAIHLINTLKSVNDTALSDWQGVIGDELDEQREEKSEREEKLLRVVEDMEQVLMPEVRALKEHRTSAADVERQIELMRREFRLAVSTAAGGSVPLPKLGRKKIRAEAKCPSCGEITRFRGPSEFGDTKAAVCSVCRAKLFAHIDDHRNPYLTLRLPVAETVACPACERKVDCLLDPAAGSSTVATCKNCGNRMSVTRMKEELRIRGLGKLAEATHERFPTFLPEGLLETVRTSLPDQPWPPGTSRMVAAKLNLKHSLVSEAIQTLIRRGKVYPQVNGVVYTPITARIETSPEVEIEQRI